MQGRPLLSLKAKDFRKLLTDDIQPCSVNFWNRKLNIQIDERHWKATFSAAKETRLRVLQWKVLHNIPTNILLNKMGIASSNKCSACNANEPDYIEHFFFSCEKVKPIWKSVEDEIYSRTQKQITITEATALLGYHENGLSPRDKNISNHLIRLAKMCISKFRYGDPTNILIIFEKELLLRNRLIEP